MLLKRKTFGEKAKKKWADYYDITLFVLKISGNAVMFIHRIR